MGSPHFVLVLFNIWALPPTRDIRRFLLSDEAVDTSVTEYKRKGVHVISTWEWDHANQTGSFWLRQDVMEAMQKDGLVAIWRTDDWSQQSQPQLVPGITDTGLTWADELQKKS
jgi:hypothetical protein